MSSSNVQFEAIESPFEGMKVPRPIKEFSLVRAEYVFPVVKECPENLIEDGYVLTQGTKILEVGSWSDEVAKKMAAYGEQLFVVGAVEGSEPFPMHEGLVMPGFVKGHGHDHESPLIGLAKDVPLVDWLDGAVNLFNGFLFQKREMLLKEFDGVSPNYITYIKARVDDLTYGITSTLVHHCNWGKRHVGDIVEANMKTGTKMFVAVGSQDRHYDPRILDIPNEIAIKRLDEYAERYGDCERTWIVPGPDQIFSNSDNLLASLKKWANEHDTILHIHSSEEPNTTKWFREKYGCTPVEYADKCGLLDDKTVIAHQVNNTENDLKILRERGVKISHNPLANTILGSGMPPIPEMLEMGIPVAIATDGSGSADNQNILTAARLSSAYFRGRDANPRHLPALQCMEMITRIPASFMRLPTGELKPGLDADWVMIDLSRPQLTPSMPSTVVNNLLWAADGSECKYVTANGVLVVDDYKITTLDVAKIRRDIKKLTQLFHKYIKEEGEVVVATGAREDQNE